MKKTIITTSILALFAGATLATEYDMILESKSDLNITSHPDAKGVVAGNFSGKSVLMEGVNYEDISVYLDDEDNSLHDPYMLHGGIVRITGETLTVNSANFKNINMHSQYQVQGGAIYLNSVGAKAVITGSTFDTITSSVGDYTGVKLSEGSYAMGSAIISWQGDLSVSDTVFNNNKVVASQVLQHAEGGAIYLMMTGKPGTHHTEGEKVSFTNVKFTNNRAENTANNDNSAGGAIIVQGRYDGVYDSTRSLTFTDTEFQNNQAGWGGAIYSDTQSMTFNVSAGKELAYTGNKSLNGDNAGGFIYMDVNLPDGGTTYKDVFATFNIAENAKLTIGDGREGYDSIASENGTATINKTGAGSLVVNSSMEYFTGTLNVNAGTMEANNGLGASRTTVNAGATFNADGISVENKTVALTGGSSTLIDGGVIYSKGITTLKNVSYKNNDVSVVVSKKSSNSGINGAFSEVLSTTKKVGEEVVNIDSKLSVSNGAFTDNTFTTSGGDANWIHGSLFRVSGVAATLDLSNVDISRNSSISNYHTQGLICLDGQSTLNINNSNFSNNVFEVVSQESAVTNYGAMGGVIFAYYKNTLNISNSVFNSNIAKSSVKESGGGALYLRGSTATFNDTIFTNNSTETIGGEYDGGGAIYAYRFKNMDTGEIKQTSITFNITKNLSYLGNYVKNDGVMNDKLGGFIRLDSATVAEFNILENAKLTIGDGREGYDSISGIDTTTINKTGTGSLTVNSSMEYFTGTLNVNAGTMEANNGLGAKAVNIANGATLNVGLTSTSLTSATVVNDGVLGLKRGTLADGDTLKILLYSGEGKVNAFGGSFSDGVFTAGKTAIYTSESSAITVGSAEADVQTVSFAGSDNNKLVLDFDVAGKETMTVNSITEVEVSEAENITGEFITGFEVDATYNGDLSVVLSAYVGEIENVANLLAWHREDASDVWTKLDGKIEYDASTGLASIFVDSFSSYAFSQIPEPSTYAMILGAIALGFVTYRRRK